MDLDPRPQPTAEDELTEAEVTALQDAAYISLVRGPVTPGAQALVLDVSERLRAKLNSSPERTRPLGSRAVPGIVKETGIILGALLSRGRSNGFVTVNGGHSAAMWKPVNKAPLRNQAFWGKVAGLRDLGLVEQRASIRYPSHFGKFDGEATRLRATEALRALAEHYGCTSEGPFR